ncbi:MAG: NAD(P)-dependent oxidoreductase [Syntrophales bacterium]|jgi:3-hydroxyisobutyrate dehydrogenase|nr:NAD(P)-dependent oxidoreductase [Syntrophales bacterium]MCK9392210.1 NAD(P)-dependent oxidoreductase [Syntrophales bacterium]
MNPKSLTKSTDDRTIGFAGLGIMGKPMALNMVRAGTNLIVWNRSSNKCEPLRAAGAQVAENIDDLFERTTTVLIMLLHEAATDAFLGRGTTAFAKRISGHTIVNMGSTPPSYSRELDSEIRLAGGRYVEAPVSGSRKPAEEGILVGLLAGNPDIVSEITPLLQPMFREIVFCGPIGHGLLMKLAVNLYLITMFTGLVEAIHFADKNGLDLEKFQAALDAGPMASNVTKVRGPMIIRRDFNTQSAISDCLNSTLLITSQAREANLASPLIEVCKTLYAEATSLGHRAKDMAAVLCAIEARTNSLAR